MMPATTARVAEEPSATRGAHRRRRGDGALGAFDRRRMTRRRPKSGGKLISLQTRPAKVALIWLLSLLAAVVCFGFLRSSGVVDNGVIQLGGAFAGFVVSLFALNRIWGKEPNLEAQAISAGSEFTYEEIVKALDLRHASPNTLNQRAPLTDYYRAKRLGDAQVLQMHYATTSAGIEFRGSATHPTATWRSLGVVSHTGPNGEILTHEYTLDVDLGELAKGEVTPIISNVVYENAFKNSEKEWLETHLEHPTGRLTMIVLAPDDMKIIDATGAKSVARGPTDSTLTQPTVIQDGSVVYWSIESPLLGARYALSWMWLSRVSTGSSLG
jgi:hypothetical protein